MRMMRLYLIRHGATKGNNEKRYVGRTDETLTDEAAAKLQEYARQNHELLCGVETVMVSPMKRCRQTADILFPDRLQIVIEDFRECDFGEFEYRNFQELDGHPAYQQFIDSLGKSGFPGGEDREVFQKRCVAGFESVMQELLKSGEMKETAFVVHGGTIMALLDRYSIPHKDYYGWQVSNGKGFVTEVVRDLETVSWQFTEIKRI